MRAAAAARAAVANRSTGNKSDVVEHVHVGRYCFPLYSHPAFRTRLEEDAYVREKIEAQLRSPALQSAVEELVEELLAQGTNGVSSEELQRLLQSKLATLDVYHSNNGTSDENVQTLVAEGVEEGQTTSATHAQPHPPLALDAVACNTKRRVRTSGIESYSPLTIISRDSVTCTLHTTTNIHIPTATTTAEGVMGPTEQQTHSTPLLEDTASPSQAVSTLPSPAAATLSQHANDVPALAVPLHERRFAPAPQLPPGPPLITHASQQQQLHDAHSHETPTRHSRVMPDLQPAVIAAHDFLPQNKSPKEDNNDEKKLTSGSGEASWKVASRQLSSRGTTQHCGKYNDIHDQSYKNEAVVPLRQWRGAVHGAVYSLLQQRLTHYSTGAVSSPQESAAGHVLLSEMNRASNTLLAQGAVDTEMLQTRLSDKVFAELDVAMDGNSSCLHHRRRAPVARRPNAGLLPLQVSAHQRAARQRLLHEQQMLYDCEGDGSNHYGSSSKLRSGMQDSVQSKARRIAASLREKKIRAMCEQGPHVQQRQSIVELASRTHTTPAIREESSTNSGSITDKSFLTSHSVGVQPDTRRQSEVMEQGPLMHSDTHTGRTSLSHKSSSLLLLQPPPRPPHLAGHHAPSYLTSSFHDVCAPLLTFRRLHSPEMRTLPGGLNVEAGNVPTLASCDLAGRVQPMPLQATQHLEGRQSNNEGDVKQQTTMTTTSNQARMASRWTTQDAAWNKALQRIRNGPS